MTRRALCAARIDRRTRHVGIYETAIGFPGDDGNEISAPVTPQIRGIDGINPFDPEFAIALRSGVTTVATGPGQFQSLARGFGSPCAHGGVLWMKWCSRTPLAMKAAFGENPKNSFGRDRRAPVTRMAIAALVRDTLYRAKEYEQKRQQAAERSAEPPRGIRSLSLSCP